MDSRLILPSKTVLDGNYRILRLVGCGGFGITYEAEDCSLGTVVAIKEYYPVEFADRDSRMRVHPKSERHEETFDWGRDCFLQEARTLARFEHPSIVRVTRVFEANSTAYMVMRFEQGQQFGAWLDQLGRPPNQQEVDSIIAPLLDALEVLHAAEFLHRDIAPDNIIVRPDGTPVLLDFGAARRSFAEMSLSPGGVIKAGYSPPEQYSLDSRLQGPWSDLYALGATLYRAVTGRPPEEATLRIDHDAMAPASRADLAYRQDFLAAIDGCLKVRHSERPQSVAQLRAMLLGRKPGAATQKPQEASGGAIATLNRAPALPTRSFAPWLTTAAILLAGVVVAILASGRWRTADRVDQTASVRQELALAAEREADLEKDRARKAEEERAAKAAEEARNEAERRAELEAENRRNEERAAAANAQARERAEHTALVKSLQTALSRVGCYAGDANGQWNSKERTALQQFAKLTKMELRTDEPTTIALHAVVARTSRVCPLKCGEGTVQRDDTCVAKVKEAPPSAVGDPAPRAPHPEQHDPRDRNRRVTTGGYATCGRNGCQRVPRGCYAVRGAGGGGLGGKIICP